MRLTRSAHTSFLFKCQTTKVKKAMMSYNRPETTPVILPCGVEHLETMLDVLDELHTAASEGSVVDFTGMNQRELISVLREVMYLAQETIDEIEKTGAQKKPVLRLVEKVNVRAG